MTAPWLPLTGPTAPPEGVDRETLYRQAVSRALLGVTDEMILSQWLRYLPCCDTPYWGPMRRIPVWFINWQPLPDARVG